MRITRKLAIFNIALLAFILALGCSAAESQEPSENIVVADLNVIQNSGSQVARDYNAQGTNLNEKTGVREQFGIAVTGYGSISAKPNLSLINLGVETRDTTVESARSKAATAMTKVLKSLRDNEIEESDIQTRYFNIYPEYTYKEINENGNRYTKQTISGYRVSNSITAKIKDMAKLGEIIDDSVTAGEDSIRINSVDFTLEDNSLLQDQARELAISDAVRKADHMASLTGTTRGRLVYISDNYTTPSQPGSFLRMEASAFADYSPTPISTGDLTVNVSVSVIFEIVY